MQLANISWLNLLRLLSLPLAQQLDAGVREGLIVRTRTDANTVEARSRDYSEAEAAMASGAQAVSTDYYPGAPDPLNLGFVVTLPERAMARCSPERVSAGCRLRP